MSRPNRYSSPRLLATVAKSAVAILSFATTLVAYTLVDAAIVRHTPLPDAPDRPVPCAIWLIGSSSIHRWTSAAATLAPWRVYNRGVNGASLDDIRQRFGRDETTIRPAAIIFYGGENDIAKGATAAQAVSALADILDVKTARMPQVPLFVVGLKPSPARWGMRPVQLRFNLLARDLVKRHPGTAYFDVGRNLLVKGRPGPYYEADGIHLSPTGYAIWGGDIRHWFDRSSRTNPLLHCPPPTPAHPMSGQRP